MNQEKRICKKCLLRDMAEQDQKNLKKYLFAIKEEDRVNEAAYENRLSICMNGIPRAWQKDVLSEEKVVRNE